ncbi:MAG TPA: hypothetical protein VK203_30770 [Nostocaceae cyanobacterium]|nr:hypothetical protein [Nostocaceae cyanobacterium]
MTQNTASNSATLSPESPSEKEIKRLRNVEHNYRNNLDTDYTEKIKEIDRHFKYSNNSNYFWTPPEQSILYGTPLYEAASESQKIALNHLFWVSQYNYAAYSEMETIDYNQITGDCFSKIGGKYEIVARQLEHESAQERVHIHAFYKVNYQAMKTLLGQQAFVNSVEKKSEDEKQKDLQVSNYQFHTLRFLSSALSSVFNGKERYQSEHFSKLEAEKKFTSATTRGFFHGRGVIPSSIVRFFAASWGSSPFLACQYYTVRYMGNMLLKNQEHTMFSHFRKLQNQGEFVPEPTALSYYHFLDEAFHTTTSLFLARDLYKNFPKPTAYEKLLINLAVYIIQRTNLSQISAVVRNRFFGDDVSGMIDIYKLLRSPIFEMSHPEAIDWVEKCFCHEHEGFHQSVQSHKRLMSEIRQLSDNLDYLWPVNREMRLMAAGTSISGAISSNIKTFQKFSEVVTC